MIDTANIFLVGAKGDEIVIMLPPYRVSKERALLLAAYLVTVSGATDEEWHAVLDAVKST